ncbi:energy-coupling factor ABC transporter permease [Methylibium sp. T29]|uniref:energy-coupling factor ABC transporter permease n=1 Tax=Methylibium sp. T29 TaxID=1430884 RepID=UPI0003F3F89D|nr:energy-coupling factor ABC transporter permease [Methylibium sp. T29]EWS56341.1 cobalt transport protein CbiM [Methylibium sp. T29]MBI5270789.1 energy-coupling factor ABC transporter permease [Burkholderiales bacterium]
MHMEPGIVDGTKTVLSYATATACALYAGRLSLAHIRQEGAVSLLLRSVIAATLVFVFFEVFPHVPVGVSEVHLILGSSLFLLLGAAPTAVGLTVGLAVQGLFFEPQDLPQYGMNVTTLLAALFVMQAVAKRVLPANIPYVDLGYSHVLKMSVVFQGGIVAWVAFWTIFGRGFGAETLQGVGSFGLAYMTVVLLEPLIDLAALAGAKALHGLPGLGSTVLVTPRLHRAA